MYLKYGHTITILLISLINFLFSYKYISRTENSLIIILGIAAFTILPVLFLILYYYSHKLPPKIKGILDSPRLFWCFVSALIVLSAVFFFVYPQTRLNLDRYEMINLFWDNLFSKKCPYCPRTEGTNIPGPFPFYFVLAFPFYLIREIGFLSLAGVVAFMIIIKSCKSRSVMESNIVIMILLSCPAVIYEIFGRSTIFLNSVLILMLFIFVNKTRIESFKNILITGILAGFILSTRSFSSLLILLVFIYKYKINFINRTTITTGLFTSASFALTFVPVVALCKQDFLTYNPLMVQFTLVPVSYAVIICLAALTVIFFINKFCTFCWFTGIICTSLFVGHMIYMSKNGLVDAIMSNAIDVAYVSMTIPFLLYSLFVKESENLNDTKR